jgi:hypothetical protein
MCVFVCVCVYFCVCVCVCIYLCVWINLKRRLIIQKTHDISAWNVSPTPGKAPHNHMHTFNIHRSKRCLSTSNCTACVYLCVFVYLSLPPSLSVDGFETAPHNIENSRHFSLECFSHPRQGTTQSYAYI